MTKARNIADIGSNDVLDTDAVGLTVSGDLTVADSYPDFKIQDTDGSDQFILMQQVGGASMVKFQSGTNDGELYFTGGRTGVNKMKIATNGDIIMYKDDGTTAGMTFDASTANVAVNGTVTAGGLTVDGDAEVQGLRIDAVADVELEFGYANTTHSKIIGDIVTASPTEGQLKFQTSSSGTLYERMRIATNGDITMYKDDGSTAGFFWDASTERLGIGTLSPDAFLDISGTGATTSKMFEISTGGVGGGPSATFYGGYVQAQANNNATDSYGWYATAHHSGIESDTTGIYGQATMNSSSNRSIGTYGVSSVNSAAVHNGPGTANSKVAAGVYAEAITTGTSSNSTNAALIANNKTTSGNLAYGAFIKVNSGATNPVPLAVDYNGYNVFDVTASDATFNEDGIDRDFRVESDNMTHALFLQGNDGKVGVFNAAPRSTLEVGSTNARHGIQLNGGPNGVATQIHMIDGKSGSFSTLTIDVQLGGAGGYFYQVQVAGTGGCRFQTGGGYTNGTNNFSHSVATGSSFTVTSPSSNLIRLVCTSGVGTHPGCEIKMTHALNADHDQDNVTITWS